tara:strand:+ start:398 stop:622 length:225 start_codon:yes stop_codon:yes gene_type:complete
MGAQTHQELKNMQFLYNVILFFIIANPMTYKLVSKIFSMIFGNMLKIANADGCATTIGLLVHAVVFALLAHYLM